jgi:stress response protein YsnF
MNTNDEYTEQNRLQELGGSDFKIAEGEPNIKGWSVKDPQGRKIGEVDELLFDAQTRKVRYIVLDLEGNVLDLEPRDVLIPIGVAELHESDDDVIIPNITAEQFRALPVYEKGRLTRETETSIRNVFAGMGAAGAGAGAAMAGRSAGASDDFYNDDTYNEEKFYGKRHRPDHNAPKEGDTTIPIIKEDMQVGKREVETGQTNIRTRIVEKPVEERVNLREEHVDVERRNVDRPATDADLAQAKEQDIKITEHSEEAVVNKEARVVEEINIHKDVEERDETIRGTVRDTEVDIDKLDPNDPRRRNNPNDPNRRMDPNDPNRRMD